MGKQPDVPRDPGPLGAAAQVQAAVEGVLAGLVEGADYCKPEGFYCVRVLFGERDFAVLRKPALGDLADTAGDLVRAANAVIAGDSEGDMIAILERALSADTDGNLWQVLDRILTPSIREWTLPEFGEVYGRTPGIPERLECAADRPNVYRKLPLSMIARMLVALVWLEKNLSGSSKPV